MRNVSICIKESDKSCCSRIHMHRPPEDGEEHLFRVYSQLGRFKDSGEADDRGV